MYLCYILPPYSKLQVILALFVLSQTSLSLTKFIEKYTDVYNIKLFHYIDYETYLQSAKRPTM